MPAIDTLTQAKNSLERTDDIIDDTENLDPLVSAQTGQLAALIAIAERLDKLIETIENNVSVLYDQAVDLRLELREIQ